MNTDVNNNATTTCAATLAVEELANLNPHTVITSEIKSKFGLDNWSIPESVKRHPYFVELAGRSMVEALNELDKRMRQRKDYHLISSKRPHSLFGWGNPTGRVGVWAYRGRPVITIDPGYYWDFTFTHSYVGNYDVTEAISVLGFTSAQAGQSSAIVVEDPENRVFVVRNGGFAAFGIHGNFVVLETVDMLNLGSECAVSECIDQQNRVLGYLKTIRSRNAIVATFLHIPANNVGIVQQGDDLLTLKAGQHVITDPKTTFRRFYSLGERQVQIRTQPAYTIEGVPVILNVNLRYRIADPVMLTRHYEDAFVALQNPAQTAVNSVVSRMSYQQFMRAAKVGKDLPSADTASWIETFREECIRTLSVQASQYGIIVESFDVMDRELEGELGKDLEKIAEQVLENQMQATQLQLQKHIATETQKGELEITCVKADQTKTDADANYYAATKTSDAAYYEAMKKAEAAAKASELEAVQRAKNILTVAEAKSREIALLSEAYGNVTSDHVKQLQLEEVEVQKRKALPAQTVYFGEEGGNPLGKNAIKEGLGFTVGKHLGGKSS